jgi:DNA-binding transcriptional LysR family regulator
VLENFRLKVFRAVAEQLSFRKAGEALYLTQPAVTLQIKSLEEELGVRLFDRRASGVVLTTAGTLLVPFAEQLHRLAEEAEHRLAALHGGAAGELALGASTTIAQYVLPPALAEFSFRFPEIKLQVFSENTEQISEGVAAGRFGLGLIEGPPLRRDLKVERWFDDEMLLVVPSSHEWAGLGQIEPEKLYAAPLVMRERGSGSRHVVELGMKKCGLRLGGLRIVMELDSTEAILACVEEGLGVGFVSEWAVARRAAAPSLVTLRLQGIRMRRHFSFVFRPGPELLNSAEIMLHFLRNRLPSISKANRSNPKRPSQP